jgi:RNase H-like domain found in reverse transcriptase
LSDYAISSLLLQKKEDVSERIDYKSLKIEELTRTHNIKNFFLKLLSPAERNHYTIERELFGLKKTLTENLLHIVCNRHKINCLNNHKNPKAYSSFKIAILKHLRWAEKLNRIQFEIHFINRNKNDLADYLSRPSDHTTTKMENKPFSKIFEISEIDNNQIRNIQKKHNSPKYRHLGPLITSKILKENRLNIPLKLIKRILKTCDICQKYKSNEGCEKNNSENNHATD